MIWRVKGDSCRGYGFTYDNDNRLLNAKYGVWSGSNWTSEADRYSTNLTYDHNGNILTMKQNGVNGASGSTPTYGLMDDMKYFYNGNKLIGINDRVKNVTFGVGIPHDFNDGQTDIADATANNNANITETDAEYTYDLNGNLTYDKNKGMTVSYGDVPNIFNLPQRVSFGYNNRVEYDYAADGQKLRKRLYQGNVIQTTTDYLGEFVYTNGAIDFLHHEEGRCVKTATSWQYQYNLKDHLGNVRVVLMTLATKYKQNITIHLADAWVDCRIATRATTSFCTMAKNYKTRRQQALHLIGMTTGQGTMTHKLADGIL